MKNKILLVVFLLSCTAAFSQINYPYPVKYIYTDVPGKKVKMAYMDEGPSSGKIILLLHGKNFNGYYWKDVMAFLIGKGYRVIVPDQVGWGKSDHPETQYSFHLLASNTKQLLDSIGIKKAIVIGHSMGGMLATRFTLMFPEAVEKLILENPIGLEDYKTFVPYQSFQTLLNKEKKATYESYKKYQQTYYPVWKPAYEQYVQAQAADLVSPDFEQIAVANALTYQMIMEQPVCYEFSRISVPVLLIIGQADRTIVGKDLLPEDEKKKHGLYPLLGKRTREKIRGAVLKEFPGAGHIPHIQEPEKFNQELLNFLMR